MVVLFGDLIIYNFSYFIFVFFLIMVKRTVPVSISLVCVGWSPAFCVVCVLSVSCLDLASATCRQPRSPEQDEVSETTARASGAHCCRPGPCVWAFLVVRKKIKCARSLW